jgi:pyruvate/2-oxoglutarate/acetoin dehydrogenase E1 component
MDQHPDLPPSRAVLAAVAIGHEAEALVSADPAFAAIPGLRWVDPGDPAAADLLLTAQLTPA